MAETQREVVGGDSSRDLTGRLRSGRVRLGAVVAVGLAAGLLAWIVLDDDADRAVTTDQPPAPAAAAEVEPVLASLGELTKLAGSTATPLYWAGPRTGRRYELTRTSSGAVYLRYLPRGSKAGTVDPALTVVTYPMENGLARIRTAAERPGNRRIDLPGGGLAIVDPTRPTNIHFAYPGQEAQVEVYSPEPGQAQQLVLSGAVRPL